MGLYLRKGIGFGPLRLNLSKSGLGVSAGVTGFRVGSGPRGTYVHAGRGGVYYRQSLSTPAARRRARRTVSRGSAGDASLAPAEVPIPADTVPAGGGEVVETLDEAASQVPLALVTAIVFVVIGALTLPYGLIAWGVGVVAAWLVHSWDAKRRNAHLVYRVDDEPLVWFRELGSAVTGLRSANKLVRVYGQPSGAVGTENAPLSRAHVRAREDVRVQAGTPKHLVTNVTVPEWNCGPNALYFLPDRLLVRGGTTFGAVAYRDLSCEVGEQVFREVGRPPADAERLGTGWEHERKDGGRDRRYSNNRRVTLVRYATLTLSSYGGLHWMLQCSDAGSAQRVAEVIARAPAMPEGAG